MKDITYEDIKNALNTLESINRVDKNRIKQKYLQLSKIYHPDTSDTGDKKKFQEINDAYHLLMDYINDFRFEFSKEEFRKQYPLSDSSKDGLYGI
jgi:DnaJ-class molecular chaperone